MVPLQAKFVIESFALEVKPIPESLLVFAADSGANKLVLLFHLSQEKKRHSNDRVYRVWTRKCRLTSITIFCYVD